MPRLLKTQNNASRQMSYGDFSSLTKKRPEKSLTVRLKKHGGRDKTGRLSIRHQGGGSKKLYRLVDFKFMPFEGEAKVTSIEYDPNRSSFIALIEFTNKKGLLEKKYIVAPNGIKVGDLVTSGSPKQLNSGSRLKLADVPIGIDIHNIEIQPGKGGQLVRAAGASATVTAKEGKYAFIKMPSSEIRKILLECMASVGRVSNPTHNLIRISKAGRIRRMGKRPSVRGLAMAPNAHPHGGGEGNSPIGMKYPKTPWGKPALGVRTRRNKRTNLFIITRRKKK